MKHRSSEEQATDILKAKLKRLEPKTARRKTAYEIAQRAEDELRQKIARLNQLSLPMQDLTSVAGRNLISEDTKTAYVMTGPLQDIPQGDGIATTAPASGELDAAGARERVAVRRAARVGLKPVLYLKPDIPLTCAPEVEGIGPHLHEEVEGKWYCVGQKEPHG